MTEFLPLCDVLFNVISLAGYFCDVVFDVVLGYALFERGRFGYFTIVICLVMSSLIVSQIVSLRWYWSRVPPQRPPTDSLDKMKKKDIDATTAGDRYDYRKLQRYTVIAMHFVQFGVLWRYAKLFVPVDLRRVKHEVRDLCMLRLVHAFCEAAPMLLLQLYLLISIQNDSKFLSNVPELKLKSLSGQSFVGVVSQQPTVAQQQAEKTFKDLNVVSAALSLFSVCWALASFSKNVRLQNVHRLVLTWLGVIFQFLWRLGTVISRIASLTVYASLYKHWVFLVIILHWFSMFLWLISPKNVFHGERISKIRKGILSALIAFVYIFAYINLQEVNHRQKMFTFYIVMFLENVLLVCLWVVGIWPNRPDQWYMTPLMVFGSFLAGMFFMVVYYRFFHVRRLNWEAGGRYPTPNDIKNGHINGAKADIREHGQPAIAGVFNCRFTNPVGNGATKRKKKKPTTFVPPPTLGYTPPLNVDSLPQGPMPIPFWRRPLTRSSQAGSSENEGSVGSRVNIHQKLQEKKQKQLAELKIIEEEIKQGKLGGPGTNNTLSSGDDGRTSLPRQPIPRTKKHINLDPMEWGMSNPAMEKSFSDIDELNNLNKFSASQYEQIYSSFGLSGINIPALEQSSSTVQNLSPNPSSQVSATESNSLTRQVHPRAKIPHNAPRNPFVESYRHPARQSNNNSPVRNTVFDHLSHQNIFLEINHPRQISGTYSSNADSNPNHGVDGLPFPYNVVPPPRSKLDSRSTPPTPSITIQQQQPKLPPALAGKLVQRQMQRAKTPEVLLAPHYLDNSRVYYDWVGREHPYRIPETDRSQGHLSSGDENLDVSAADDSILGINERNGHRIPSDIDSQVSLPRSYTLPREFKYYRRNKGRKFSKNDHFITSTNSSDGDVDSGDDNETDNHSDDSQCQVAPPNPRITPNNFHSHSQQNDHHSQLRSHRKYIASPTNQQQIHCGGLVSGGVVGGGGGPSMCVTAGTHMLPPSAAANAVVHNGMIVNNLDLISGVDGQFSNFPNRPRTRNYGIGKHNGGLLPYSRETKL